MPLLRDFEHFSLTNLSVHLGIPQIETLVTTTLTPSAPSRFLSAPYWKLPHFSLGAATKFPQLLYCIFLALLSFPSSIPHGSSCSISLCALLGLYIASSLSPPGAACPVAFLFLGGTLGSSSLFLLVSYDYTVLCCLVA